MNVQIFIAYKNRGTLYSPLYNFGNLITEIDYNPMNLGFILPLLRRVTITVNLRFAAFYSMGTFQAKAQLDILI